MNEDRLREIQNMLGARYEFLRMLPDSAVQWDDFGDWECPTIAQITAGCVRIEAYRVHGGLLGCAVYVKDRPDANEWITFCNPLPPTRADEVSLFETLDCVVREQGLSYTECCFEIMSCEADGVLGKKCGA